MASVAGSAEVWGYASGRVSPIPAAEGGGQELNLAALIHGHMAEELPWIKLFHADKSYAEFVNEVFFLSLARIIREALAGGVLVGEVGAKVPLAVP